MSTFLRILAFELGYHARRPSTHIYFAVFFVLGALLMIGMGGGTVGEIGRGGAQVGWANSPYTLARIIPLFSLAGLVITAPLLGRAVQRDFAYRMHPLVFSQPVSRHALLGGRFVGAILANAWVLAAVPLGLMLASFLPMLQPERIGPFRLDAFGTPYLVVMLPNLLFSGAIFFALAARTRRMLPNYVGGVALLVAYSIAANSIGNVESLTRVSLLDPFGMATLEMTIRYWSALEQHTGSFPVGGPLLLNRAVWLLVGAIVLALGWWRFRFVEVREVGRRPELEPAPLPGPAISLPPPHRPGEPLSFAATDRWRQYWSLTGVSFLGIVRDVYFYALTAAGLLLVLANVGDLGSSYGTPVEPSTSRVLGLMLAQYRLFVIIVAAVYAGELVWNDRDLRTHGLTDSMPVPTGIVLAAKLTALSGALAVMLVPLVPMGVATQTLLGYHHYQIGLYLGTLFGMRLPSYLLIGALALGVHAIVNHKYLAHVVVIVALVATTLLGTFDLVENVLLLFDSSAGERYSEMLGYGSQLAPFYWLKAYWAGWMMLLLVIAYLLWLRGEESGLHARLRAARARFGRGTGVASLGGAVLVAGAGGFVYYNTHILNPYVTTRAAEQRDADYERTYKRYAGLAQPHVTRMDLNVELFPSEQRGVISGTQRMVNRSEEVIDTLHLFFEPLVRLTELEVSGARPGSVDLAHAYHAFIFEPALAPGDSAVLRYGLEYRKRGFRNSEIDFPVRQNGTFLEGGYLGPSIGYDFSREVGGAAARRRHGLPPATPWPARDAPGATSRPRFGSPGGVEFTATVGTDADQTAIATGDLVSRWSRDGRAWFRYEAPRPVRGYGIVSGRWVVSEGRWGNIDIAVYHHPTHDENVGRMIRAVQATLEYSSARFGPYPFGRVAIAELPRSVGGGNAESVEWGLIVYGEDAGFSSRIRERDIEIPFYITSHEVAHSWWGGLEIPAAARGGGVLTESLAQYTALMVMKHEFDPERTRRFLRYVLDRYLIGRARETSGETALAVTERGYGAYEKGALVMFALQERLGEDQFNTALQGLMREAVAGSPPYPTTLDLMRHLREVTPDSLQELVEDAFDRIVLYDNRVSSAEAAPLAGGGYAVRVEFVARKMVADSVGLETEVPMQDPVDLVVYGETSAPGQEVPVLLTGTYWLTSGESVLELEVPEKPGRVVLDPFYTLMDRRPQDNERNVVVRRSLSEPG